MKWFDPTCSNNIIVCISSCALFLVASLQIHSQEQFRGEEAKQAVRFIYTPDRRYVPLYEETGSITVIEKDEIEQKEQMPLVEAFREVPSAGILKSGTVGEEATVSIRGASSNQTLMMFEGLKLNSPFDQKFDLGNMVGENISKIEILRGPQSSMYGSEAIGGVVNIFAEKPSVRKREMFFRIGYPFAFHEGISFGDRKDSYGFNLSYSRLDSKGHGERDAFHSDNFQMNKELRPSKDSSLRFVSQYIRSYKALKKDAMFSSSPVPSIRFVSDKNRDLFSDFLLTTVIWNHSPSRLYDYALQGGFIWNAMQLNNPPDDNGYNVEFSNIDTFRTTILNQHNVKVLSNYSISLGYEFLKDDVRAFFADTYPPEYSKEDARPRINNAFFFQNFLNIGKNFKGKAGIRFDHISDFGSIVSPRVSLWYHWKEFNIDISANYGEGFRAPTYRELFLPETGNPDLSEERSRSFDIGIRHYLIPEKMSLNLTYFHNYFRNLITFTDGLIYENVNTAQAYGGESFILIEPADMLVIKLSYTYTKAFDTTTEPKTRLPFVPENRFNANVNVKPTEGSNINLNAHFITDQQNIASPIAIYDADGALIGEKNPGYIKVDLAGSISLVKNGKAMKELELNLLVDNVLNKKISDLAGTETGGIGFFLGVRAVL